MKIQIVSDLHLEFYYKEARKSIYFNSVKDRDLLILAGDIGVNLGALEFVKEQLKISPVVYVPGNHEYYAPRFHEEIDSDWKSLAIANKGLYYLINDLIEISGVKIYGTPLHSDLDANLELIERSITDFKYYFWNTYAHQKCHNNSISLLENLEDKPDIIVTHWPISLGAQQEKYKGDKLNPYFVNDREDLVKKLSPKYWISGHVHEAYKYKIGDTILLGNPLGYVYEEPSKLYKPDLTIIL